MKLLTKSSEKLEGKYSQVYQEIRVLSETIWQRLKAHTAFFRSTAALLRGRRGWAGEGGGPYLGSKRLTVDRVN